MRPYDLYVVADQIDHVDGDIVQLAATRDELAATPGACQLLGDPGLTCSVG